MNNIFKDQEAITTGRFLFFSQRFRRIAKTKNATSAKIALAWLLAQSPFIVPIQSTKNLKRMKENWSATNIVLTTDEINIIESSYENINIQGERLPFEHMTSIDK